MILTCYLHSIFYNLKYLQTMKMISNLQIQYERWRSKFGGKIYQFGGNSLKSWTLLSSWTFLLAILPPPPLPLSLTALGFLWRDCFFQWYSCWIRYEKDFVKNITYSDQKNTNSQLDHFWQISGTWSNTFEDMWYVTYWVNRVNKICFGTFSMYTMYTNRFGAWRSRKKT